MDQIIIITDMEQAAAVLGELHSYHRHCEAAVTLAEPLPAPEVAAWHLARDVTPPNGSAGGLV